MRARIAILLSLALPLAFSLCFAQQTEEPQEPPEQEAEAGRVLKLACPADSTYIYWVESTAETPETFVFPTEFEGATHKIDLAGIPDDVSDCFVLVVDAESGNMSKSDVELADGETSLALTDDEFDLAAELVVAAKGLKAGRVTVKDAKDKTFSKTILPADKGKAGFVGVAIGTVEVRLAYGSEKMSVTKDIEKEREDPVVEVAFALPGVEAEEEEGPEAAAAPTEPVRRPVSAVLNMVLALVIVAMAIWIVVGYVRRKGVTMDQALGKLGVDLPQGAGAQAAPADGVAVPEGTCPYCGKQLDPATGTCPACAVAPAAGAPGALPGGAPKLVGSAGAALGQVFALAEDKITIGREPGNAIALTQDTTVSRKHAEISKSADGFVIRDLGSSNGTFVNGARITEQALSPGDEVQVGSSRFRFEIS